MKLDAKDVLPADMQGWNFESPVFEDMVKKTQAKTVVEVGTWKGMSAIKFYKALEKHSSNFLLFCCDTWLGGIEHMDGMPYGGLFKKRYGYPELYFQFLSNLHHANCLENMIPIVNTSTNCARYLKAKNVNADLIYIDGSHEQPDVYFDCKFYWDILKPGAIMFGDDYNYGPVNADVIRFANENKLKWHVDYGNYWVIEKPVN